MRQETVLYKTRQHLIVFFFPLLVIAVGAWGYVNQPLYREPSLLVLAVGLAFLIITLLSYLSKVLIVTNNRVIIRSGIIIRRSAEMVMDKIEMVNVVQSILGKILGYGTLTVTGTGGTEERFSSLNKPYRTRSIIEQAGSED